MSEKHFIEVENNEEVASIHHEASTDNWIFFCHGYGSDKEGSYEKRAEKAVENGFNAVRFDFRGNRESDGKFIDQNLTSRIADLEACINYFDPENIYLFGMSFGGKVVLHTAEKIDLEGLIFKSPVLFNDEMDKFKSVVEEKGTYTHFGDKTIDERFFKDFKEYSFDEANHKIDFPIKIFHGGSDSTVRFESSAEAMKKFDVEASLRKMKGEKHSMSDEAEEKILDEMFYWLKNI